MYFSCVEHASSLQLANRIRRHGGTNVKWQDRMAVSITCCIEGCYFAGIRLESQIQQWIDAVPTPKGSHARAIISP